MFECAKELADCQGHKKSKPPPIIDRVTISCLFLRNVLIFKGNVLQNVNVVISKKRVNF